MKKFFLKRKFIFILFALFTIFALFYMTQTLNSINQNASIKHRLNYEKDEVEQLRAHIAELESKAKQNENSLRELDEIYKGILRDKHVNLNNNKKYEDQNNEEVNNHDDQMHPPGLIDLNEERKGHHYENEQNKKEENEEKPIEQNRVRPLPIDFYESNKNNKNNNSLRKQIDKLYTNQCEWFGEQKPQSSDIEIANLYESLSFDNIDGGVWKQGFDITYDPAQWTSRKKLKVIIVPHSHNDPGWLMTFEEYFNQRTKYILDTVVNSLSQKETRKFIWAETSYLSLWWAQASQEERNKMRRLIVDTKQLEIVTGGWVMTDEANSNYYAMIEQMVEGHEWLKSNIDASIRPTYGWSIDPFGYTPTMAYLLKQMGFDAMLIQRVHYHLKKYLAKTQRFEFKWRQSWSSVNSKDTSIFCHVMPFYSYDVPHTCGPDPKICCQFDFKRMTGGHYSCPWGIPPVEITQANVNERAQLLLDQYRKKSQLYGDKDNHNVVLIPLGDDFRYTDMNEARAQFENYERLIEHINSNEKYNAEIRFGTLSDYFKLVAENDQAINKNIETFSGDFFTYADRDQHYWSGYYTSRPFHKRLDRLVESYLRSAEIIFSLANLMQEQTKTQFSKGTDLFKQLLTARRNLALFQHHDGITGTSKTPVVFDYARKLYVSLRNCQDIIEHSTSFLLTQENLNQNVFKLDDVRLLSEENEKKSHKPLIQFNKANKNEQEEIKVVLYNPNMNHRSELVSFKVNVPNVDVIDNAGLTVQNVQLSLAWSNMEGEILSDQLPNQFGLDFESSYYELTFEVDLKPLSLTVFTLRKKDLDSNLIEKRLTKLLLMKPNLDSEMANQIKQSLQSKSQINIQVSFQPTVGEEIKVPVSEDFNAFFSARTGFLQRLASNTNELKTKIKLVKYGTTSHHEKSGAYLFLPDGPARELEQSQVEWIRVEEGTLRSRVCVKMSIILHCVEFFPTLNRRKNFKYPFFSVWNVVDIRETTNYELAMHFESDLRNERTFYTDLNGFQFIKRKTYDKLPIQGNIYPMPTGAFLQDKSMRINLLTAQPLGFGSLEEGSFQVFLDRRLNQDDNRGLEQPMNDNIITPNRFLVFFETINQEASLAVSANLPSLMQQWLSHDLLNPITKLVLQKADAGLVPLKQFSNKLKTPPCDLRLVNMRTMQNKNEEPLRKDVGVIIHRVPYEDCPSAPFVQLTSYVLDKCKNLPNDQFTFEDLFEFLASSSTSNQSIKKISNTYLTLVHKENSNNLDKSNAIVHFVQPMQIEAFRIEF